MFRSVLMHISAAVNAEAEMIQQFSSLKNSWEYQKLSHNKTMKRLIVETDACVYAINKALCGVV